MRAAVGTFLPPSPRRMWFALFGAPIAWAMQGLMVWYDEAHACSSSSAGSDAGIRAMELGVTTTVGVVAVVALLFAVERWRESRDPRFTSTRVGKRPDFLAAAAMFVSSAFLISILVTGFAGVMLNLCQVVR